MRTGSSFLNLFHAMQHRVAIVVLQLPPTSSPQVAEGGLSVQHGAVHINLGDQPYAVNEVSQALDLLSGTP